jgi:phytoene dehydrogenase-like protein
MREFLRIVLMNAADLVEDELEDPRLAAALAFDAVLGSSYGPRAPGTVLPLLYRCAGGAPALAKGGTDGVVEALLASARAAGVVVKLGCKVAAVSVEKDRCTGIVLADGRTIRARHVLSSVDPRTTCLDLLGARYLDTGMVRRLTHLRSRGAAAKLALALDGLPDGLDRGLLAGRLLRVPSIQRLERASDAVKYGRLSDELMVEAVIPSLSDPSLVPAGGHVVSAVLQYAPYRLDEGWETGKPKLLEAGLAALAEMLPGIRKRIVAARLCTPADIEREFGVAGGHWHHGELVVDQMLMLRPVPGLAQYRTPVDGLYLCGAGSHPGGGISGVPGMNAARAVLAEAA